MITIKQLELKIPVGVITEAGTLLIDGYCYEMEETPDFYIFVAYITDDIAISRFFVSKFPIESDNLQPIYSISYEHLITNKQLNLTYSRADMRKYGLCNLLEHIILLTK